MPIYELWTQTADSVAAGTAFLGLIYMLTVMVLVGTTETSSRITWSLARDDAFELIVLFHRLRCPCRGYCSFDRAWKLVCSRP